MELEEKRLLSLMLYFEQRRCSTQLFYHLRKQSISLSDSKLYNYLLICFLWTISNHALLIMIVQWFSHAHVILTATNNVVPSPHILITDSSPDTSTNGHQFSSSFPFPFFPFFLFFFISSPIWFKSPRRWIPTSSSTICNTKAQLQSWDTYVISSIPVYY